MKPLVPGDAIILQGKRHQVLRRRSDWLLLDNGCGGPHAEWIDSEAELAKLGAVRVKRSEQLQALMAERNELLAQVVELRNYFDLSIDEHPWEDVMAEVRRLSTAGAERDRLRDQLNEIHEDLRWGHP